MKKILPFLLVVALAVIAGWFWLERNTRPDELATNGPGVITPVRDTAAPGFTLPPADALLADPADEAAANLSATTGPIDPERGAPDWVGPTAGDLLDGPDEDHGEVAKKLVALVRDRRAPMVERDEALSHALNLAAGRSVEILTPLVTDPDLPDMLTEIALTDVLNDSLSAQADLYLAALGVRRSPELQQYIRDHLAFLLDGRDLGPDPAAWRPGLQAAKKAWETE